MYHADSYSKKVARLATWRAARGVLGDRFASARLAFLASEFGGDVRTLKALRHGGERIAVDYDIEAVKAFMSKFPGERVVHGKFGHVVHSLPGLIDAAFVDYCGYVTPARLQELASVARKIRDGGVLAINVCAAHEKGESKVLLDTYRAAYAGLPHDFEVANVDSPGTLSEACGVRSLLLSAELSRLLAPRSALVTFGSIAYHSGDHDKSAGSPMLTQLYVVCHKATAEKHKWWAKRLMGFARSMELLCPVFMKEDPTNDLEAAVRSLVGSPCADAAARLLVKSLWDDIGYIRPSVDSIIPAYGPRGEKAWAALHAKLLIDAGYDADGALCLNDGSAAALAAHCTRGSYDEAFEAAEKQRTKRRREDAKRADSPI